MKTYHIIVVNERTGCKVYMTCSPLPHGEACNVLKAIGDYPWRSKRLEPASETRQSAQ